MSPKLLKTLDFFRLLDETGQLSLSNLAVMVVLAKLALSPTLDFAAMGILLPVIGNYTFKRYHQRRQRYSKESVVGTSNELLTALVSDVEKLKISVGMRTHGRP